MEDLRSPIGKFQWIPLENEQEMAKGRADCINVLTHLPGNFVKAISGLTPEQLETRGEWGTGSPAAPQKRSAVFINSRLVG